jgi:hypothetical protein
MGYAALGLLLSILLVRDTRRHVGLEVAHHTASTEAVAFWEVFRRASLCESSSRHRRQVSSTISMTA